MEDRPAHAPTNARKTRRRDAVTWVLTAVTATVLVVGLLVVRSTRSERPPRMTETTATPVPQVEKSETPVFLFGEPESIATQPKPPETAGRPAADRR